MRTVEHWSGGHEWIETRGLARWPRLGGVLLLAMAAQLAGLGAGDAKAAAHAHVNAGAIESRPGAALYFVNGDRFAAESGYVLPMNRSATPPHAGLYRGEITFTALAATSSYGGPAFGHAAPGARVEMVVEELTGPAGGRFGFWEGGGEEDEGMTMTFDVPVGTTGGTQRFHLSESTGEAGDDPFGHVHGRVYTVTEPGLYRVGFRLIDTSTQGAGGGPVQAASGLFEMNLQAGVTLAGIRFVDGAWRVGFAGLAGFAYQLEASGELGTGARWESVGPAVPGDDRMHEIAVDAGDGTRFFRLRRTGI